MGSKYKYKNKFYKIGSCKHSDISTFSLHPLKTITSGEGGVVTTNNKKIFKKMLLFRSHGIRRNENKHWEYDLKVCGLNYRLSDINSALGISQIKRIRKFINYRKRISNHYKRDFLKYKDNVNLIFAGFPCFVAGTKVLTNNGYKNIEDVVLTDTLMTHTGKFQNIINLQQKNYIGELYNIRIKYHSSFINCTE